MNTDTRQGLTATPEATTAATPAATPEATTAATIFAGLTVAEAAARLAAEGANALPGRQQRSVWRIAWEVVREPMFLLLVAGAGIYLLLGDVQEALFLGAAVVVVMLITIVQERRSERAVEALRDLASPRALVMRDGEVRRIAGVDVVRGDLLMLSEGDRIPADAELVAANDLLVDESLLTGESLPVSKQLGASAALGAAAPEDTVHRVYSGTLVVKGQGRAVVTGTGAHSELGRIGVSLGGVEAGKTRLEEETARIVRIVATAAGALSLTVALLYFALRGGWLDAVLVGVTLAMAILPEEFPVVLTVFLALGAWRISRNGVLTRRMPAIETLGAATVLCVDKTGTLTENRMVMVQAYAGGHWHTLGAGQGHAEFAQSLATLTGVAALACEHDPFDPMERAILAAAAVLAPDSIVLRAQGELSRDYPMSSEFMAVCHGWQLPDGSRRVAIKGAPETVLALCGLTAGELEAALAQAADAAGRGLRLLAVAEAGWTEASWPESPQAFRFSWCGYVALADPLRASVPAAVAQCRRAGIRVVMITGDYPQTGLSIAQQAGLDTTGGALTGDALSALDDAALAQVVHRVNVYARVRPEQKLRLVNAFKAAGEVVAMTGDGVNDAPALKAAHIGVAMGRRGTDVAREAASLVLIDDDFGDLVTTVRLGRRIYANIRNAMSYIISVHVPIAGMSMLPLLFGWPLLLYPVHVAFLEFVIDPACSIVFEAEEEDAQAMERPPRSPTEPLFSLGMLVESLGVGISMLLAVALAYAWADASGRDEGEVRALGFAAIVLGNLFLILAYRRSERLPGLLHARPTRALLSVLGGALAALALVIYVPVVAGIFRFAPLAAGDVLVAAVAGAAGVFLVLPLMRWLQTLRPRLAH